MSEWISTKDRLPDVRHNVLVINSVKGYSPSDIEVRRIEKVDVYEDGKWEPNDWGWYPGGSKGFTHWMELPEAPKETI